MMLAQLAQTAGEFVRPPIDWHAAAPELTLLAAGALLTLVDIIWLERGRRATSTCLLYTSPSPRDLSTSRMPSSA